jgi:hypothetical protein
MIRHTNVKSPPLGRIEIVDIAFERGGDDKRMATAGWLDLSAWAVVCVLCPVSGRQNEGTVSAPLAMYIHSGPVHGRDWSHAVVVSDHPKSS